MCVCVYVCMDVCVCVCELMTKYLACRWLMWLHKCNIWATGLQFVLVAFWWLSVSVVVAVKNTYLCCSESTRENFQLMGDSRCYEHEPVDDSVCVMSKTNWKYRTNVKTDSSSSVARRAFNNNCEYFRSVWSTMLENSCVLKTASIQI